MFQSPPTEKNCSQGQGLSFAPSGSHKKPPVQDSGMPGDTGTGRSIVSYPKLFRGLVNVPFWGFLEHDFQVSVGDYIILYPQYLGDVQLGHLPTPAIYGWFFGGPMTPGMGLHWPGLVSTFTKNELENHHAIFMGQSYNITMAIFNGYFDKLPELKKTGQLNRVTNVTSQLAFCLYFWYKGPKVVIIMKFLPFPKDPWCWNIYLHWHYFKLHTGVIGLVNIPAPWILWDWKLGQQKSPWNVRTDPNIIIKSDPH